MKTKKTFTTFAAVLLALAIPALCWGAAMYNPGFVTVYNANNSIFGSYNVRFNTAVATGRIATSVTATEVVVSGYDSNTGAGFFCTVSAANPGFSAMQQIALSATNGSLLFASKNANSSLCTIIQVQQMSSFLN